MNQDKQRHAKPSEDSFKKGFFFSIHLHSRQIEGAIERLKKRNLENLISCFQEILQS
jgi:hypothetical protein